MPQHRVGKNQGFYKKKTLFFWFKLIFNGLFYIFLIIFQYFDWFLQVFMLLLFNKFWLNSFCQLFFNILHKNGYTSHNDIESWINIIILYMIITCIIHFLLYCCSLGRSKRKFQTQNVCYKKYNKLNNKIINTSTY